jgi:putative ABC transport system permease protein
MAATTLTGRRLLESLQDEIPEIETRLALGDAARTALAPAIRRAVHTGLIPVIDQTRSVGLVTLPGTFVGLILGGATPAQAAATQLVVLLALKRARTRRRDGPISICHRLTLHVMVAPS